MLVSGRHCDPCTAVLCLAGSQVLVLPPFRYDRMLTVRAVTGNWFFVIVTVSARSLLSVAGRH